MNRLLALGFFACAAALSMAELASHFDDPGRLLPADPAWTRAVDARLGDFERATGIKIHVEIHLKSPSAEEDKVPGAYMSALSGKLGTLRHGVLVVYFADDPDWRVWIGDELTPAFAGKPGTVKELTASGAIHDVKEAMLNAARAKADAAFAALQKMAPPNQPPTPAQHLALQADALLDTLMAKLSPKQM
ncbi:MAG TPA: hypothetical protein VKC51_01035 [Lacunisphaera sp.]|nr:hypothetical protein [Lacunisphaera sp.]